MYARIKLQLQLYTIFIHKQKSIYVDLHNNTIINKSKIQQKWIRFLHFSKQDLATSEH